VRAAIVFDRVASCTGNEAIKALSALRLNEGGARNAARVDEIEMAFACDCMTRIHGRFLLIVNFH
jgi:hypothetical protein